jgi:hypothetical protein
LSRAQPSTYSSEKSPGVDLLVFLASQGCPDCSLESEHGKKPRML